MPDQLAIERTPEGLRIIVWRLIDAPADTVWSVFIDTQRWPDWGPSITAVESANRRIETGTTGHVRTVGGLWLPFTVTSVSDSRWTWRIGPIKATGHRVEAKGGRCRAGFEIPWFAAPYVLVCWWALRSIDRLAMEAESQN